MLFPHSNTNAKHQWKEPWLFYLRSSTKTAWMLRVGFYIGVYLLFVVRMSIDGKSADGPQFGILEIILLPAFIAGMFLAVIEIPNIQRVVTLTDNKISCFGTLILLGGPIHLLLGSGQWNRREIESVQLVRAGEFGNDYPFALMTIAPKYARQKQLAVPPNISLADIADHLHSIGVDVELSGWERPASETIPPQAGLKE